MKLKDKNDVVQMLVEDSYRELSRVVTEQNKVTTNFAFWINSRFLDKDKNICVRGALDVSIANDDGKVTSFKLLMDRALVLRKNEATKEDNSVDTDKPKYGKQQGYEELRRIILSEIVGKGVTGLALGLAEKTKEQIEEFNALIPENLEI